ncbi:hypothetical protein DMB66_38680 [Actinoplanes sp. ATCC 53533]|uniref:hypothetical protein n=1 Tax=Actinoplanes sp. ATCC 53533 TaxID=1288362 RepID=UPI000F78B8A1|nr:hypothetical protein [Actinoplanes sp. ATCC 53533]RSM53729.1 hypothetical protein DMB66_38680 [Actinoplanes sp. ATCC 53533]
MDEAGGAAENGRYDGGTERCDGGTERSDGGAEPEITSACRAVRNLLQAQESLIEVLSAQGMLDDRATGVLAAIDQLKAEAEHARQRAAGAWAATHPVGR